MKKLLILFLLVCSVCSAQYGPIQFPSSGGSTFTGGTLTSDLTMGDGTYWGLNAGTEAMPSLRFKSDPNTGIWSETANVLSFSADGGRLMSIRSDFGIYMYRNITANGTIAPMNLTDGGLALSFGTYATPTVPVVYFAGDTDTGLGRAARGKPALISDGVECIRVASSGTQIFQYTKLGDAAPALKCKLITGTTPSEVASGTAIAHGLTGAKIIGYTTKVEQTTNAGMDNSYGVLTDTSYAFSSIYDATNFSVFIANTSTNLISKPISILIWYTE